MRRTVVLAAVVALAVGLIAPAAYPAATADPLDLRHRSAQGAVAATEGASGLNMTLLGWSDLAGSGNNADLWVHGDRAYVGSWFLDCGSPSGAGVRIVDVSDPTAPQLLSSFAHYRNTRTEDMVVVTMDGPHFRGELAVVGLQSCGPGGRDGIDLWNVTDSTRPRRIAHFPTVQGVHELSLTRQGDRLLGLLALPFAEVFSQLGGGPAVGDLLIVDLTNPRRPVTLSDWGGGKDGGFAFGSPFFGDLGAPFDCTPPPGGEVLCRGNDFPGVLLHSVSASADGNTAYLSYWDAGLVVVNISDPSNPVMLSQTEAGAEGNMHSAVAEGTVAVTTDEDFLPRWGFARFWNISDPAAPRQVSSFATANARSLRTDGDFSVHNPVLDGNLAYLSWYSDGVRVVDTSRLNRPQEVAYYVPDPVPDPFGVLAAPNVWGVVVENGLVYLSDMNAGLYILRLDL